MRRGRRQSGKHFSTYVHEDRSTWEIRVGPSSNGFGHVFFCRDEGVNIEADNPDKVIADLKVKLAEVRAIEWKPVIEVSYESWRSTRCFGLSFERFFKGEPEFDPFTPRSDDPIFREWTYDPERKTLDQADRLDVGKPGRIVSSVAQTIPYDPEIWRVLRGMERASEAVQSASIRLGTAGHDEVLGQTKSLIKRYNALPENVKKHPDKYPFDLLKALLYLEKKK